LYIPKPKIMDAKVAKGIKMKTFVLRPMKILKNTSIKL